MQRLGALLATRPLLVHALFGAVAGGATTVVKMRQVARLQQAQQERWLQRAQPPLNEGEADGGEGDVPVDGDAPHVPGLPGERRYAANSKGTAHGIHDDASDEDGDDDGGDGDDALDYAAEIAAAVAVGALQGTAMRFWFPAIETAAATVASSAVGRTVIAAALDAAPAALGGPALHVAAREYYHRTYGEPSDARSLRVLLLASHVEEAVSAGAGAGAAGGLGSVADTFDEEQLEAAHVVVDAQPTPATAITAGVTVANFAFNSRRLRAIAGTAQWLLHDALTEYFQAVYDGEVLEELAGWVP
jgi:hypothetical protein